MPYTKTKNIGRGQRKLNSMKALRLEDLRHLLETVEANAATNPKWQRDHAMIFMAAALGMRRGELRLFERRHFKDLEKYGVILCPTLKQSEKIQFICAGNLHTGQPCMRVCRVKAASAGKVHSCYRCGTERVVPIPKGKLQTGVVEMPIDIVEEFTTAYILNYLNEVMKPDQEFLFEADGRWGNRKCDKPMTEQTVSTVFNTHLLAAGLDPHYSTHSLRHRRGVQLYSQFNDLVAVKSALRHKSVKTAEVYADLDEATKERYREQLSKAEFNPLKRTKEKKKK